MPDAADPFDLQRFVDAQRAVYDRVIAELREGRKRTHWMWFVFPQIADLGSSPMAQRYAIASRAEAAAYLAHPVLGPRLRECARLVLAVEGRTLHDIFGSPDGLWIDPRGVMWIQTDASSGALGRRDYARLPNNQMLACDPVTGQTRRFLVGPAGCEVSGAVMTPDLRTMFVNIQHPGEPDFDDPGSPHASRWPDGGRPRSATIAITRDDGGEIGS